MTQHVTQEHKLLTLIDRGLTSMKDLAAITARSGVSEISLMHAKGWVAYQSRQSQELNVVLSKDGLERLNQLDARASKKAKS